MILIKIRNNLCLVDSGISHSAYHMGSENFRSSRRCSKGLFIPYSMPLIKHWWGWWDPPSVYYHFWPSFWLSNLL